MLPAKPRHIPKFHMIEDGRASLTSYFAKVLLQITFQGYIMKITRIVIFSKENETLSIKVLSTKLYDKQILSNQKFVFTNL